MFNRRIRINFVSNLLYQMSLLLLPLVLSPYLTRSLGVEPLGRYQYVNTITLYFCNFCILGIATYGNRECAVARKDKGKLSEVFWGIYGIQLAASAIVLAVYFLFLFVGGAGERLMGICHIPLIVSYALDITWLYYGLEYFYKILLRNFVVKIISIVLVFLFVKQPGDVYRYCLIMTMTTLASQMLLWPLAMPELEWRRIRFSDSIRHLYPILTLFLSVLAVSIYSGIDKIMIGNMIGKKEVAIYSYAENLAKLPVGIVTSLTTVMLPHMSKIVAEKRTEESRACIRETMNMTLFLALPVAAGVAAISDKMVPWFYTEEFIGCIPLIKMLVVVILFIAWTYVVQNQCLIPMHRDLVLVKSSFLVALLNVCANLVLIPRLGVYGAALGTIFSEMLVMIYKTYQCRHEMQIIDIARDNIWKLAAAIIMYVCVYLLGERLEEASFRTTLVQVGTGIVIYVLLCVPVFLRMKRRNRERRKDDSENLGG